MRLLLTGASSKLGAPLLDRLLGRGSIDEVWCGVHRTRPPIKDSRIRLFPFDLARPSLEGVPRVDRVAHLAAVTHASSSDAYRRLNRDATAALAREALARGCKDFVFVSTRCLGLDAGAYADSKREAEEALETMSWRSLTILRPAEVYGARGREGVDRFISLASRWHLVPMIFGDERVRFSPLHVSDFIRLCADAVLDEEPGRRTLELCGPEALDGVGLARRLAARYRALPVPLWWPAVRSLFGAAAALGFPVGSADQPARLTGGKSADAPSAGIDRGSLRIFPG